MHWKLDNTHDLIVPLRAVEKEEELAQRIKVALLTYYNEWFDNRNLGIDYINTIFRRYPDLNGLANEIRRVLSGFEEIRRIININIEKVGITYNINILIESIYNENQYINILFGEV
jgi:hypothetical protein